MDLLKRRLAPVLPEAWELIDEEARRILRLDLAGRRLVDVDGPHGWKHAAVNLGSLEILERQPVDDVHTGLRRVQPLIELRTPIKLELMELDNVGRGEDAPDLEPVTEAAERMARAEDNALFHGNEDAAIRGMLESSPHDPIAVPKKSDRWPHAVVEACEVLRGAGIDGPYGLALGPRAHQEVARAAEDGYPIRRRVQEVIGSEPLWAPALEGAVLLSRRGGDFTLTLGQDLSIGYAAHDKDHVELFLAESFTFRIQEPAAAVEFRFASS